MSSTDNRILYSGKPNADRSRYYAIAALGIRAKLPHLLFSTRIPAQILWYCE
ncbi:hypothetical protein [Arthrospira platensis]|uniref:hypothetical protein n=1 Tax=Limnospira TaxID=2596745 RepID=UPI0001D0E3ED|nr:hypothetical protein [Arthrospira platensis]MBD2669804.1 hypothetical protein [Arthrospira platensis FACHB-439]MBD2710408.1 hypothetical protein [Arthrospira platensis FACHB-835]MDF2208934.1 hypothetical protein [Arthrospira platensis NCB002]MDT9182925.1 hypothetical protein [Limnospira sp. PMC 289.06]MDT9295106.1 hypothetical protein [Arthrospira platensis PCC 7345]MDT9310691.1 hypothetical protein [Limnospira sp. Paracas R14]QQW29345.1 hypothetical protein AP9108_32285 [Arthrospira sp. 